MKIKLLLALLVFTTFCSAQIINFPDANFKAKLLAATTTNFIASTGSPYYSEFYNNWSPASSQVVDTNGDGEIQVAEAQAIKYLDLKYSNITNLTGIEYFTNLESLRINNNTLTSLHVSQNTALKNLRCENNLLTSITLPNGTSLLDFNCEFNNLSSLNVSTSTSLQRLYCNNNNLTALQVLSCSNLKILHCNYNDLVTLDVSQLLLLENLQCNLNEITNLNVSGCTAMKSIQCYDNNLTTLDVSDSVGLTYLRCSINQLTSLNVSNCANLDYLECHTNLLTELDLSDCIALQHLRCYNNYLVSLDVSPCPLMNRLHCNNNNFQLQSLNLKNGVSQWVNLYIHNNSNLIYICADEENVDYLQQYASSQGITNFHINSYCSFTPGGTYYEVTGNTYLDYNTNGCDASDLPYKHLNFTITDGVNFSQMIANQSGGYYIPVGTGTFTITPNLESPSYFNISPANFTVGFPTTTSPFEQDFCVTANGVHPDVEIVIIATTPARPGFDATYTILAKNKGNQVENGAITFAYNASVLEFLSANPLFDNQTATTFTWNYTNLLPFETKTIDLVFNVNSPMETPAVNIDDLLSYTASISTANTDDTPNDNTFTLNQTVVGSYDPNDKTCLEGAIVPPAMVGKYVHYVIRFENTGTYAAENVVIKDIIDTSKFEIATLVPMHSSHEFVTRIINNRVEFLFEGINLPFDDANNDGYVMFKIKTKPNLGIGSTFSNSADIYFDYNFPIITNDYTTTVQNTLGVHENDFTENVLVYPNPVHSILQFKTNAQVIKVVIYDLAGRIISSNAVHDNSVNVSDLETGTYTVTLYTEKGMTTTKIIKL